MSLSSVRTILHVIADHVSRREDPTSKIGKNLARIFQEKGHDFFDKYLLGSFVEKDEADEEKPKESDDNVQPMTPEELFKMRMEILPQLQ